MEKHPFPPQSVIESLGPKMEELHRAQFGYHMLPFEHSEEQGSDVGLTVLADPRRPLSSMQRIMHASVSHAAEPFSTLAKRLDNFFDSVGDPAPLRQIVYCRECRQLHSISMAEQDDCPACGADLIAQS